MKIQDAGIMFKISLSWSTLFKMALMRHFCWELYYKHLQHFHFLAKRSRSAIAKTATALIVVAGILCPQYLSMNRAECAAFDGARERYQWLTWNVYTIAIEQARINKLSPVLIMAVIDAESRGNARAVSSSGARGLMQVMARYHYSGDPQDLFTPRVNIMVATRYLHRCQVLALGHLVTTLRNYERGPAGRGYNVEYTARIVNDVMRREI